MKVISLQNRRNLLEPIILPIKCGLEDFKLDMDTEKSGANVYFMKNKTHN